MRLEAYKKLKPLQLLHRERRTMLLDWELDMRDKDSQIKDLRSSIRALEAELDAIEHDGGMGK
jgi:hypothetical protein